MLAILPLRASKSNTLYQDRWSFRLLVIFFSTFWIAINVLLGLLAYHPIGHECRLSMRAEEMTVVQTYIHHHQDDKRNCVIWLQACALGILSIIKDKAAMLYKAHKTSLHRKLKEQHLSILEWKKWGQKDKIQIYTEVPIFARQTRNQCEAHLISEYKCSYSCTQSHTTLYASLTLMQRRIFPLGIKKGGSIENLTVEQGFRQKWIKTLLHPLR